MKKTLLVTPWLLLGSAAYALDCQTLDEAIATSLQTLKDLGESSENYEEAKEIEVHQNIVRLIQDNAADSWDCEFPKSQAYIFVANTAADKRLRTYAWDTMSGGTMREYRGLLQYRDDGGNTHVVNSDLTEATATNDGKLMNGLFTADLGDAGTAYIITAHTQGSLQIYGWDMDIYRIQGDKLTAANIIQTPKGLTNNIGFAYNPQSIADSDEKFFEYNAEKQTFSFPVVVETTEFPDGQVTPRRIAYHFDGQVFVYGNTP